MKNSVYMGYNGERLPYEKREKAKPTQQAYDYGRTEKHPANQKMIAIIAYGNRNGNSTPEDAWTFKGRGLLQITGRENYEKIQSVIDKRAPQSGVNVFDEVPHTGYTPYQAAITGMAEWVAKDLHAHAFEATKDNDDEIVNKIVNKLNSKTKSRAKRIVHYRGGSCEGYSAPEDKNGNSKYKPTKVIFKFVTHRKERRKENGR